MQEFFKSENMNDFLKFRKMITPAITQVLFWIGAGVSVLSGLVMMGASFGRFGGGAGTFFLGLLTVVLGPIVVRIYCEILILFFRMNETLTEIKNGLEKK
jgi:hypothetical protein